MIDRNSAILVDDCLNETVSNGGGENQQMECRRRVACSGKLVLHNKRCHESKSRNSDHAMQACHIQLNSDVNAKPIDDSRKGRLGGKQAR